MNPYTLRVAIRISATFGVAVLAARLAAAQTPHSPAAAQHVASADRAGVRPSGECCRGIGSLARPETRTRVERGTRPLGRAGA